MKNEVFTTPYFDNRFKRLAFLKKRRRGVSSIWSQYMINLRKVPSLKRPYLKS